MFISQSSSMKSSKLKQWTDEMEEEATSSRSTTASSTFPCHAPTQLFTAFAPGDVQPWEEGRFEYLQTLCCAPRNKGVVKLVLDNFDDKLVAIKQMPNTWVRSCHKEFIESHPKDSEFPWQDIGCTRFLNSVNFKYACKLEGVFRNDEDTFVALTAASEGDLFGVALAGVFPGLEREVKYAQVAVQLMSGMKQLHNMQISHGDMSLENVLLTKTGDNDLEVKIIDYSMASTHRTFQSCARGKLQYQAPEMHTGKAYDSFLSESFSVGVILYALFVKDYPWLSTKTGVCNNFEYTRVKGFRGLVTKRKLRGSSCRVIDILSEPLLQLLEGMLAFDPQRRLSFGEDECPGQRPVWDEPWIKQLSTQQDQESRMPSKDSDQTTQEPEDLDSIDGEVPQDRVASDVNMTGLRIRKWLIAL